MTRQDPEARDAEIFRRYIAKMKMMIVDPNAAACSSLFGVMRELGAHPSNLFLIHSFSEADQMMSKIKPGLVLTEFMVGEKCGLDLLKVQRERYPSETLACLFIIVTSNHSQSAAARSLEEEVDAYIVKPYTLNSVRRTIMRAALKKISPSPYGRAILEGKAVLASGNLEAAERFFLDAVQKDPSPCLAYSYLGEIRGVKNRLEESERDYQAGLKLNRTHYRCLVGLYNIQLKAKKNEAAYQTLKRLSKSFPPSADRLSEVLRLAIMTKQYDDIEQVYQTFKSLDDNNPGVIRSLAAALIVCGKYYLSTKLGTVRALELFKKACAATGAKSKFLREVIFILLERQLHREAAEFLSLIPPDEAQSEEAQLLRFLIFSQYGHDSLILEQGHQLLAKGIHHEKIYEVLIKKETELGNILAAEKLLTTAREQFPGRFTHLEALAVKSKP